MRSMATVHDPVPQRWWRRDPVAELPLALLLTAVTSAGVAGELAGADYPVPPHAGGYAIAAVGGLALAWRRRHPGIVAAAVTALFVCYHVAGYPGGAPVLTLFVALYALAAYG